MLNTEELLSQYSNGKRDFSNKDLKHIKIPYESNLQGINFSDSNLSGVKFYDVNFENANFENADLIKTEFSGSLHNANLNGTDLRKASFVGYLGTDIQLIHTNISNTDFYQVMLDGSDFSHANIASSHFFQSSFEQTDFSFANLSNSIMTECTLHGADFTNANISKSYLEGHFQDASFKNTNLRYSILCFDHDLLDIGDWSNAILEQTIFFGGFDHPHELLSKLKCVDSNNVNWVCCTSDLDDLDLSNYNFDAIDKLRHILKEAELSE